MTADTLVLDMNWQPVGFCDWMNAVKLYWEGRAKIIKEDEAGRVLHSPSFEMGLPRVILVKNAWTRRKRMAVPCTRRNLLVRDNAECQYCGRVISTHEYTQDHVIPQCQGRGRAGARNPCGGHGASCRGSGCPTGMGHDERRVSLHRATATGNRLGGLHAGCHGYGGGQPGRDRVCECPRHGHTPERCC